MKKWFLELIINNIEVITTNLLWYYWWDGGYVLWLSGYSQRHSMETTIINNAVDQKWWGRERIPWQKQTKEFSLTTEEGILVRVLGVKIANKTTHWIPSCRILCEDSRVHVIFSLMWAWTQRESERGGDEIWIHLSLCRIQISGSTRRISWILWTILFSLSLSLTTCTWQWKDHYLIAYVSKACQNPRMPLQPENPFTQPKERMRGTW